MHLFGIKAASLLWFFIGYWILKRGWISIRPLFIFTRGPGRYNDSTSFIIIKRPPQLLADGTTLILTFAA